MREIRAPLTEEVVAQLRSGDAVRISGVLYVARDAAHKRMVDGLQRGEGLPFEALGQIVYYMGPSPERPGNPTGSAGPTTSGRMDLYSVPMLAAGIKGMLGKGSRSLAVRQALQEYRAVYLAMTGGVAALIAQGIQKAEVIAYEDLGPEALRRLRVVDLPAIVINDVYGEDAYEEGRATYRLKD